MMPVTIVTERFSVQPTRRRWRLRPNCPRIRRLDRYGRHGFFTLRILVNFQAVRRPHEVVAEPNGQGYVWSDELPFPAYMHFKPFWEWPPPGSYLDNPLYANQVGKYQVVITNRWGRQKKKRVIETEVPNRFQDLFQYRECGFAYRYVEGYEPK